MTIDWQSLTWSETDTDATIRVNVASPEALLADLGARIAAGRGFSVATLNLDHVVKLRRLPRFRAAYAAHSHVTADGNPIVWILRLAGDRVRLTPGSELVGPVAALAARAGVPVGLFGATGESLRGAAAALEARHPGLRVAARIAPPMGFDPEEAEADRLIAELAASGARVVFLALGAPKQEILAARIARAHPGMGILSIGAGLDFLSGAQNRAPAPVRALALEWVWRLAQDPGRLWRRYRDCFAILPGLTVAALRLRGAGRAGPR
ncbi:polymer biosynthesis protein, WecB/TagA/CpsF family [Rhodovulum sp. ES.010]|uniref:WecB/TagA/CpsF family glycosyltransferase n=1 Tax=Rhodovulum sp. ES.010 TaxID=1882821 RepID=UPI000926B6D6|nr:WecB/TagA/CpsF family glycosyltransferase [Rhodovulum sp. ES.010]SIO59825.1 polymer biosynthesis protein, WecB/TagA/CpsF family [Rhodovulum sp. ES.010]